MLNGVNPNFFNFLFQFVQIELSDVTETRQIKSLDWQIKANLNSNITQSILKINKLREAKNE